MNERELSRMLSHICVDESTGCWRWEASTSHDGYGRMVVGSRLTKRHWKYTHRLMFEHFYGDVPYGLVLDHLCKNRACCNPSHLEAVSQRENLLRGDGVTADRAAQTHCVRGHEFTPENTRIASNGCRKCRACATMHSRNRNRSRRAEA